MGTDAVGIHATESIRVAKLAEDGHPAEVIARILSIEGSTVSADAVQRWIEKA